MRKIGAIWGPVVNVSGVVCFEDLSAAGVRILRDFEEKKLPGLQFTFGPAANVVVVRWDSTAYLAVIARMAGMVANQLGNPREAIFTMPDFD
jgi:hypothetical protein